MATNALIPQSNNALSEVESIANLPVQSAATGSLFNLLSNFQPSARQFTNKNEVPSMEFEPKEVPVEFTKHGNKIMAGDADISMGGIGLASILGNDSLNLGLNSSDIKKHMGDRKLMNAVAANYAHQLGDAKLMASVMSPQGVAMRNINLMGSIPVGEGTATLGAQGSHGFGQKQLNALSANYNLPLEHGNLNANIARSLADKRNSVNLNYSMPF